MCEDHKSHRWHAAAPCKDAHARFGIRFMRLTMNRIAEMAAMLPIEPAGAVASIPGKKQKTSSYILDLVA